jgi:hypothetical protein
MVVLNPLMSLPMTTVNPFYVHITLYKHILQLRAIGFHICGFNLSWFEKIFLSLKSKA